MYHKYDVDWLKSLDIQPNQFYFWGHTPKRPGVVDKSCLSQWFYSPFKDNDGVEYSTSEHYMMYMKAFLFNDSKSMEKIISTPHPNEAKSLGRKVKGFEPTFWDSAKHAIVYRANYLKFNQNPELQEYLVNTGESILVEASPYDTIWGVGLSADDPKIKSVHTWNGENLLGFVLMEVRDSFQ
jgi:ribA/ribD-fused uncharacterized protein